MTWEENRALQLEDALRASPAERLAWLEEAILFAFEAGALEVRTPESVDAQKPDPQKPGSIVRE